MARACPTHPTSVRVNPFTRIYYPFAYSLLLLFADGNMSMSFKLKAGSDSEMEVTH